MTTQLTTGELLVLQGAAKTSARSWEDIAMITENRGSVGVGDDSHLKRAEVARSNARYMADLHDKLGRMVQEAG